VIVRALSRFILAVSNLIEAQAVELRHEGQRLVSYALGQFAAIVFMLGGVALILTGTFLFLQQWIGAAWASLIAGGLALLIGMGLLLWLITRENRPPPSAARPALNEPDKS
jgi:uncharacterized membrane protein